MSQKIITGFFILILLGISWIVREQRRSRPSVPAEKIPLPQYSDSDFYLSTENQQTVESPIHPIPQLKALSAELTAKINLGQQLFQDVRLSGSQKISCMSCHILTLGGHDPRGISIGTNGSRLKRNSPTVLNAAFNFRQFWDGRSHNLAEQAGQPLLNPDEMGGNREQIITQLSADPAMVEAFSIYPQGIQLKTIQDAISLYERTLITPDNPFDRYLKGDNSAISNTARRGYTLFRDFGCISCHQGRNVGGNLFQKIGVYAENEQQLKLLHDDQGRFEVTGNPVDHLVFKVPSLRNVALTAPYFHDGSRATLEEAVSDMGALQLGRKLNEEQINQLVAFLNTLSADLSAIH